MPKKKGVKEDEDDEEELWGRSPGRALCPSEVGKGIYMRNISLLVCAADMRSCGRVYVCIFLLQKHVTYRRCKSLHLESSWRIGIHSRAPVFHLRERRVEVTIPM
jgi:hypothetical protein